MSDYDTVIIGGGPAGLSAAIHLAFHRHKVLVLDRRTGPLPFTLTPLYNVPGFTIQRGVDILKQLEMQAKGSGATLERGSVKGISGSVGAFRIELADGREYGAKTLLLATGVARHHPLVSGDYQPWLKYAAKGNTYYCPDCESPEMLGRDILVVAVGSAAGAISVSRPLLEFASRVRVLLTGDAQLTPEWEAKRAELGLEVIKGRISSVEGSKGIVKALLLEDGSQVSADGYYVDSPKLPRNELATQLGLELSPHGHIKTGWRGQVKRIGANDSDWLTGVWAAGDVQPQTQQVSIALGSGNIAAVMIDQYLQKTAPRRLGLHLEPTALHS